ncbi:hypothetical protein RRG08_003267 [Elysia crispata]|uniref:Uncharacterized protein n=1 Tax=Elysia crispata TaxID=231223 RepID=A0AAE1AUJ0_9GAST|nr:hypothetical protein RRG08_003267 [Elysia crispata]
MLIFVVIQKLIAEKKKKYAWKVSRVTSRIAMGSWLSSNMSSNEITKTALALRASAIARQKKLMFHDEESPIL